MTHRTTLAVCGACAAVAIPTTALAAGPLAAPAPLGKHTTVAAKIRSDAQSGAERRTLRLARREARLRDTTPTAAYKAKLDGMNVPGLADERSRLRDEIVKDRRERKAARTAGDTGRGGASPQLEAIAACESGGNPSTNTGNGFYGKYQFTQATWAAVGGSGNPAAASEAEQDSRAAKLLATAGSGHWPVCGG
ncbi:MAG: transglycosylase family protein [Solirubrobacteraceae bacterium]